MILVVGGSGRLGGLVANRLVASRRPVRVLSRGLKADPARLHPDIERVTGDVRRPGTLRAAMRDVDVVVSAMQGFAGPGAVTPQTVDRDGAVNLVSAAEQQGADVVLLSVLGAAPDSPMELFRMKHAAEQRLRASSVGWTVVRPDAFAETWLDVLAQTAGTSGRPVVFGNGDRPTRWVGVEDVAELVVMAVLDPTLRGRELEICGPDAITLTGLAELLMAHWGVPGSPRRVPRAVLWAAAQSVGRLKPQLGRQMRASLAMDRLATNDDTALRAEFPELPCTRVTDILARMERR
jgi:NADH dehydrogenase